VTPIPRWEVLEQFALVFHGIVPALQEGNLSVFGEALHQFSGLGFKAREITEQGGPVADTISALRDIALCVGMSSMGPLVFAITEHNIVDCMPDLPFGTTIIGETVAAGTGFRIRYD
jgi:beta-ribofuranosylaminobenzene 5'-phosphate synthase